MYRSKRSRQRHLTAQAAQIDLSSDPLHTNRPADHGQAPSQLDSATLLVGSQQEHFQPQESASQQGPTEKHPNEFDPLEEVQMMDQRGKRNMKRGRLRVIDVWNSQVDLGQCGQAPSQLDSATLSVGNHQEHLQPQGSTLHQGTSEQHGSEFDPLKEVQIMDQHGKIKITRERIRPADVWNLPNGERIVVQCDGLHQPVMKSGGIFTRWLGLLAKRGDYCPIDATNWKVVKKMMEVGLIKLIRGKFVLPGTFQVDKVALKLLGNKWRNFRHELKAKHLLPGHTQERVVSLVPDGVSVCQWIKLVEYWFSKKGKTLSKLGKQARHCLQHVHTTGAKSYARLRHEFEIKNGRPPGIVEFFALSHQRKDGSYVDDSTKEFMVQARSLMVQRAGSSSSSKDRINLERHVFAEQTGEETPRRVRGSGEEVTPGHVYGLDGELGRMDHLRLKKDSSEEIKRLKKMMKNESESSLEIKRLKKKMRGMEHKIYGMEITMKELKQKIYLLTYFFQQAGIGLPSMDQSEDSDDDFDEDSDDDLMQTGRRNNRPMHPRDDSDVEDTAEDSEESSTL
ncbi:hypothetical protein Dimus_012857 [Dionaea muscipula]